MSKKAIYKYKLTNDDPIIEEKARYFADSFDFSLSQLGTFGFASLENHRSLLDKIRFQLQHFHPQSKKYLEHYFKNPMLSKSDSVLKKHYPETAPIIARLKSGQYTSMHQRQRLLTELDNVCSHMEETLLKHALEEIQTVLHCTEPLAAHQHMNEIDQAAEIIICELIFKGHHLKDLNKLIENILSNKVKIVQDLVYTQFPLPPELVQQQPSADPEARRQEITEFMENRTLRQQFEGIYNLYQTKHANTILFKVLNTKSKKRVDKSYENVRITNQVKSYINKNENGEYSKFFSGKDDLYIEVSLPATNDESAQILAREMIGRNIARFDHFYGVRLIVDFNVIISCIGGIYNMRSRFSSDWIREANPEKTRRENKLKKLNTQASQKFLHLESIFAEAKTGILADLKLNNYWRYLESSFSGMSLTAEQMQQKAAGILSNYRLAHLWFPYFQLASDVLWENRNGITGEVNLSYREIADFMDRQDIGPHTVTQANGYINHPYLNRKYKRFSQKTLEKLRSELCNYYQEIFLEAYEQRNLIQHSGQFHKMAINKLLLTFPDMMAQLRHAIEEQSLKGKLKDYPAIIAQLETIPKYHQRLIKKRAMATELK